MPCSTTIGRCESLPSSGGLHRTISTPTAASTQVFQISIRLIVSAMRTSHHEDRPMRLPEADIAIIDRAAGLRGRSRMDFVREAAVRVAEEVLMENTLIRMSPKGFKAFLEVLA